MNTEASERLSKTRSDSDLPSLPSLSYQAIRIQVILGLLLKLIARLPAAHSFREQYVIEFPAFRHTLWNPSRGCLDGAIQVGDVDHTREGRFQHLFNISSARK